MPKQPDRAYLRRLLSERNQFPDRIPQIDELIRKAFERRVAILALDMCGFSRLTAEYGIVHYLAMIHQMEEAARPAVAGNGGQVIKQEADNLFAIFETSAQAFEGALDVFRAFEAINTVVPPQRDIYGSIGIGYGDTLVIGDEDMFGPEMNLASKLGEDLAGENEILLTTSAYEALPPGVYQCEPASFSVGRLELKCHRFVERLNVEKLDQ